MVARRPKVTAAGGASSRSPARALGPEALGPLAEALDVAQLDVLVAAHDVGQLGELQRDLGPVQRAADELAVLADQRALDAADLGQPEDVERRPAQPAHRAQRPEGGHEPAPELELALHPEGPQQRRMQHELDLRALAELGADPGALDG